MKMFDKHKKKIARLLTTAFFLACLPLAGLPSMNAYAAPGTDTSTEAGTEKAGTENTGNQGITVTGNTQADLSKSESTPVEVPYTVTPDAAPAYEAYKGLSDWKDRKVITAPKNTYVLTVATGASAGSTVLYFAVKYTGTDGVSYSQYIFPGIDADSRSMALLTKYADGVDLNATFGKKALSEINYKETDVKEETLGAWTVQDYAFQTSAEIRTVESFDVYLAKGQWTVQGLALYKMDKYKGYEEYGLVSGQKFLDFEGNLVADLVKKQSGTLTLSTGAMDSVIRIGGDASPYFGIQNYAKTGEKRNFSGSSDIYSMRVDFSDVLNGGLESFLNLDAVKLSDDNGIVEDLVIEIQYQDRHKWARKVTLPVVLSSYIMARRATGKSTVMGMGQRGDMIAFQAILPEFGSLVSSVTLSSGSQARKKLETKGINISSETTKMKNALSALATDELHIAGVSFFKGGCMPYVAGGKDSKGQKLEGATLDYVFEAGDTPLMYYSTTDQKGQMMSANGNMQLNLKAYSGKAPLVASNNGQGTFLVTLYTSDKPNAGTSGDVNVRFQYLDMNGKLGRTVNYKAKASAESFMGFWPAMDGGSYLEQHGLVQGGKISYIMEAPNAREFTNVEISLVGNEMWEMSNLTVSYVERYDRRRAYLAPSNVTGTRYWLERGLVSAQVCNLAQLRPKISDDEGNEVGSDGKDTSEKKQLVDENGNPVYDEITKEPIYVTPENPQPGTGGYATSGSQLFLPEETYNIDFGKGVVSDVRDEDYGTVRYRMNYQQTQVNWKFFSVAKTYDITVQVAQDSEVDTGNGDAGSKNYFYFQLIFEGGYNSGFVQANQQLAGDAFRSGQAETFTISTNRDYGELKGIRILPEDLSSDSEPFDKLNIDSITVSERNDGGSYLSYVIDNIGWIEISYRDEAEKASARGLRARSANEISKTYDVSYKQRSVKLLCEITTLPWDGAYNQFVGSIIAKVDYLNTDGQAKDIKFDVVQYLSAYMKKSAKTVESIVDPKEKVTATTGTGAISDPATMLRPGKTDRFIMPAIPDLKSIKAITFTCQTRNNEAAYWNIGKITVSQVRKDGPLELTKTGEFYRNMVTENLCMNAEDKIFSKLFLAGIPMDMETIRFTDNQLVWTSESWATPVSRLPESSDDTVNIYVYPTLSGSSAGASSFFTSDNVATPTSTLDVKVVHANLKYNIPYSQMMAAACDLNLGYDAAGNPMFYATGVKAKDLISAGNLQLQCLSTKVAFNYGMVQHVKNNVVMSTSFYSFFNSTATMGVSAGPIGGNTLVDNTTEEIMLSFGGGTTQQNLIEVKHDIAVAFTYTSSIDGGTTEYQSPYVYLTDAGYQSISEGLMVKIPFKIPYVRRITGYKIGSYGNLEGRIEASAAVVYQPETTDPNAASEATTTAAKEVRAYASFAESYPLMERLETKKPTSVNMWGEGSVTPIAMTFTTTEDLKTMDGTKDGAVRMTFTYNDYLGSTRTERFMDMTKFIQTTPKNFAAGSPQTVEFFLHDMSNAMGIGKVEVVPYDPTVEVRLPGATEPVGGMDLGVDVLITEMRQGTGHFVDGGGDPELKNSLLAARSVNWTISKVEYKAGFRSAPPREQTRNFQGLTNGDTLRLNSVSLTTYVTRNGYSEGQVKDHVMQLVAKGDEVIAGTVTVRESQSGFMCKAYRMLGDAGEEITDGTLTVTDATRSFSFTVPKNRTGGIVIYRIDISPLEAEDLVDKIYISVESEGVGLETTISLNGGTATTVLEHTSVLVAKGGDVLTAKTRLMNSTGGIAVWAYEKIGEESKAVTQETISNLTSGGFDFKVPENTTDQIAQYRIEISPQEDIQVKDTIYISVAPVVEPTEKPEEGSTDKPAEGTTDKPAEGTTDKPAEGTTDKPAEGTTDKPAEGTTEKPAEGTTDKPAEGTTDKPAEGTTDKPAEGTTDKPTGGTTDKPAEGTTDKPAEGTTNKPAESNKEAPAEGSAQQSAGSGQDAAGEN